MVNAEFHLPTQFVYNRKSCFLRWRREIVPYVWAIIDLSNDYFPHGPSDSTLEPNSRRPSGVIIRRHNNDSQSQVIWIENVEVSECKLHDNIYSAVINSGFAFCARRWVATLLSKLQRNESRFFHVKMQLHKHADLRLLALTDSMKIDFLKCVNAAPDEIKWITLYDQGIRILKKRKVDHDGMIGSSNYIALTSFRVRAKPLSVFHFLIKKNLQLQWRNFVSLEEPEEVIKFANYDEKNCITLHKKIVQHDESTQLNEYLLQEASRDEFCSFIISAPMAQQYMDVLISARLMFKISLQPSGFAIMPDEPIHSNASLVTTAMQRELDPTESNDVIKFMIDLITGIISEINEEVASEDKASR